MFLDHQCNTNHTCPEEGPLAVLCGDLHHHPKGTIHTIDLVGASITVVYVTLPQMRVLHHSGAHHTPFLQLPEWPQYRLFHQCTCLHTVIVCTHWVGVSCKWHSMVATRKHLKPQ